MWRVSGTRTLSTNAPIIMGILNVTPDSFSDGGLFEQCDDASKRAREMLAQGADIIDIGGESTRPGAQRIDAETQIQRVIPVIDAILEQSPDTLVSVDTTIADVAHAALDAGAMIINDVSGGLEDPELLPLAAARDAGLILMHRLRPPNEDVYSHEYDAPPEYGDVIEAMRSFLAERRDAAVGAGVADSNIVLDPGLGFGKSVSDNISLIRGTSKIVSLGRPVLSGLSRKSFVGQLTDPQAPPEGRRYGSLALSVLHYQAGARIFRVHDVQAHREALTAVHLTMTGQG